MSGTTWKCVDVGEWSDTYKCVLCGYKTVVSAEDSIHDCKCPSCEKGKELMESGGNLDTLIALVENGPLFDGDVPSKNSRDILIAAGLATRVVVKGEDGYTAASYEGRDVYLRHYDSDTIQEAMNKRKIKRQG